MIINIIKTILEIIYFLLAIIIAAYKYYEKKNKYTLPSSENTIEKIKTEVQKDVDKMTTEIDYLRKIGVDKLSKKFNKLKKTTR